MQENNQLSDLALIQFYYTIACLRDFLISNSE